MQMIGSTLSDDAISYSTSKKWFLRLKNGNFDLEDFLEGNPCHTRSEFAAGTWSDPAKYFKTMNCGESTGRVVGFCMYWISKRGCYPGLKRKTFCTRWWPMIKSRYCMTIRRRENLGFILVSHWLALQNRTFAQKKKYRRIHRLQITIFLPELNSTVAWKMAEMCKKWRGLLRRLIKNSFSN